MVVVGDQRRPPSGDAVDLHQVAQGARILGHQHIGPGQHIQRPQRDVARRADRRRHEMQPRRNGAQGRFVRAVGGVVACLTSLLPFRTHYLAGQSQSRCYSEEPPCCPYLRRTRKSLGQLVAWPWCRASCLPACRRDREPTPPASGGSVQVALLVPSGSGQSQDELFGANLENAARLAMADLSGVTHRPEGLPDRRQPGTGRGAGQAGGG